MNCTIPKIFGFDKWFEKRFSDLCDAHDKAYSERTWAAKNKADAEIIKEISKRGHKVLAGATAAYVYTLGSVYFAWKKYL